MGRAEVIHAAAIAVMLVIDIGVHFGPRPADDSAATASGNSTGDIGIGAAKESSSDRRRYAVMRPDGSGPSLTCTLEIVIGTASDTTTICNDTGAPQRAETSAQ